MKLTLRWLEKHIKSIDRTLSVEEVINALNDLSIEVDQVTKVGGEGYHVACIQQIEPHPNGDRLRLCTVQFLKNEEIITKTIVCGAPNVRVGMYTILAEVGTTIPCGLTLTSRKIRGIVSDGMLLSYEEFGLKHIQKDGIIDEPKTIIQELVKEDYIITIGLPANRIDLSSVRGLSEELAGYFQFVLKNLYTQPTLERIKPTSNIEVENDLCSFFSTIEIRNIQLGDNYSEIYSLLCKVQNPSSISIVNIANFITADLGVPLHVYDLDKVSGLKVSLIDKEQEFLALTGNIINLKTGYMVVKDIKTNEPVTLAGVIGGESTKCTEHTTNVIIEAALFSKKSFMQSYRDLSIQNTSTYYFSRGVNKANYLVALEYFREFVKGSFSNVQMITNQISKGTKEIFLSYQEFYQLTEVAISLKDIIQILEHYGYKSKVLNKQTEGLNEEIGLEVQIPISKSHVNKSRDLIEEIVRLGSASGKIALSNRDLSLSMKRVNSPMSAFFKIQDFFVFNGYKEVISFSFTEKADSKNNIYIPNAIGSAKHLRSELTSTFHEYMRNIVHNKLGIEYNGNIFEISKVFCKKDGYIKEYHNLVIGILNNVHRYGATRIEQEIANIVSKLGGLLNLDIYAQQNRVVVKGLIKDKEQIDWTIKGSIQYGENNSYVIIEIPNIELLLSENSFPVNVTAPATITSCRDYSCVMTSEQFEIIYYKELAKFHDISYSLFDHYGNSYGIRIKYLMEEISFRENAILTLFNKYNIPLR